MQPLKAMILIFSTTQVILKSTHLSEINKLSPVLIQNKHQNTMREENMSLKVSSMSDFRGSSSSEEAPQVT